MPRKYRLCRKIINIHGLDLGLYSNIVQLSQLFISLIHYEIEELKYTSTKFIKKSWINLTVTMDYMKNGVINMIYTNFDTINSLILRQIEGIY